MAEVPRRQALRATWAFWAVGSQRSDGVMSHLFHYLSVQVILMLFLQWSSLQDCVPLIPLLFLPFLEMAGEFTQTLTHHGLHCILPISLSFRLSRRLRGKLKKANPDIQTEQCQELFSSLKANSFVWATSMLFKCLNVWNKMCCMHLPIENYDWSMWNPEPCLADLSQKSCQGTCLWAVKCSLMLFKFTGQKEDQFLINSLLLLVWFSLVPLHYAEANDGLKWFTDFALHTCLSSLQASAGLVFQPLFSWSDWQLIWSVWCLNTCSVSPAGKQHWSGYGS